MKKKNQRLSRAHQALLRRYLVWAYKSTKESFDRLERKTTQLLADEFIQSKLSKFPKASSRQNSTYQEQIATYNTYVAKKKEIEIPLGQYQYLADRLKAIELAITHFLGKAELTRIQESYELEFTRRIWESKDH